MSEAANKIAVVTGAGTGVGRAASLALMNAGFTVVLAGRRLEMLEETKKLGDNIGKSLCVSADMTSPASIAALFDKVKSEYGRLDVLFNNAGMGAPPVNFEDLTLEQWQAVVNTNLTGPFLCTQHAFRIMKDQTPQRRPHHQQRFDLGACAAALLGGLYLDQACHHRADQGLQPRRPQIRHRGRPGRHRQRRNPDDRSHGRRPRRDAAGRHDETGTADGRQGGRRRRRLHGRPAA